MNIRTLDDWTWSRAAPPEYRWSAIDDDTYDGEGSLIGSGPTEEAAIADLKDQLADREEERRIKAEGRS